MRNAITFELTGQYALFTDPLSKGGEKYSYSVPTYQALVGVCESIYWKPTILWVVERVRVMKPIRTQPRSIKPLEYGGGNSLAIYTYLADTAYQVEAHFEWNAHRQDMAGDQNEHKHHNIARRMLERGGRRDIFLGTRECQGYVEPVAFGEGEGAYDACGEIPLGVMVHGFDYPSHTGEDELWVRLWRPVLKNGVIEFPRPDDPGLTRRFVRKAEAETYPSCGSEEPALLWAWGGVEE